jgi:hypothetical protein
MRLRPRHRQPVAVAVQQNAMDVDDVIAAPAATNAEVIPNHLPGGGQQNQAARVAPVLVLRAHPGPADRRQLAIDHAAAAARHIRFRHHFHQHRPIHPYAGHRIAQLQPPGPQQARQLVPLLPGIN